MAEVQVKTPKQTPPVDIRPLDCNTDHPDICDRTNRQLGVVSLSGGAADVSDRCPRLLGQICFGGIPIDPRIIRFLSSITDSVTVTGSVTATIPALTPIAKSTIHDKPLPAVGTSLLGGVSISPTNTPCSFRIFCAFDVSGQLTGDITNSGDEQKLLLNGGINLSEKVMYTFDVPMFLGDSFDLEYTVTGGKIMIIRIMEIDEIIG